MRKPYVGVTGITDENQVNEIIKYFQSNGFSVEDSRIPMLGFLLSYKTIKLGKHPTNKRYPELKNVPKLFEATENKTFNTLHFNTRDLHSIHKDLSFVLNQGDIYDRGLCHGTQLNVDFPPHIEIDMLKSDYPNLDIIMQLSERNENMSVEEIIDKIVSYDKSDYILIDPSMGRGKGMDIENSSVIYKMLLERNVKADMGFAGGLSGENAEYVIKSIREKTGTDNFSVDAEGNLRDRKSDSYGDDLMNMEKVASYIKAVSRGFS